MEKNYRITRHPILWTAITVWAGWLALITINHRWPLFLTEWFMSITMVFGSFIAGATSEGGGAVAFPVMTLLFGITPEVARDFSILIQAVGMMAASVTIFCLKIPVERRTILFAGLGGIIGIALGLDVISPYLAPPYTKLFFVSLWLSFAGALFLVNRNREREVLPEIENFSSKHAIILLFCGVIGGTVSGITGSGLDIVAFSVLVLAFRICEKVATPTSVVLMGTNALFGLIWREGVTNGMTGAAWEYWYVCVPVVVLGAPVGAWFIRNRSRHYIVQFLYLSIAVQYLAALLIIPLTGMMVIFTITIIGLGLLFFWNMARIGAGRLGVMGDTAPEAIR